MSDSDPGSLPDDVPVADAVEQSRPAAENPDLESVDPQERVPIDEGAPPLEADAADWQEQHIVVDDPDDDVR